MHHDSLYYRLILAFILLLLCMNIISPIVSQGIDAFPQTQLALTQFVNPFIGTGATVSCASACIGDTFPGATYPEGMVQWSPDTVSNPPGGYYYNDSKIKELSLTHFSGRGCQAYQDFPFMPYVGDIVYSPATHASLYYSTFSHKSEIAHPGYYQVYLNDPNVTVQLSATLHTGIGQFSYPSSNASTIIINAGGSIRGNTNSSVTILPANREVIGSDESMVGCGTAHYKLYFAAEFDRSFTSYGTWNGDSVSHGSTNSTGQYTGAFVVFDTTRNNIVRVQVGISFVSIANAKLNLAAEFASFNLAAVAMRADSAWNNRLNLIHVKGGTPDEVVTFYTALYHMFFHPNIFNDANGQYLGFDGQVHLVAKGHIQYENIPGWDHYRTMIRLLSILAPSVASDIAQSLVNDAQQGDGHLPRWEQANVDSHGMSGDDGDTMIAEAYAFGATNFNTTGALYAMINGQPQIREGYSDYVKIGYVPANDRNIDYASITQEYTNDDFAIAQFAMSLGDYKDYVFFLERSGNWEHIFNNASGYVQPRYENGSWTPKFNRSSERGFEEGNSAQYSWMETYNLRDLFYQMGGNSSVVTRLDKFFTQLNAGPDSPYAWIGNEPSLEVPWEYDWVQAPSHTQEVVRDIQTMLFKDAVNGLPGNDDGGEMSSWYIFSAIGLYPEITAIGGFVIGSPLFTSVMLNLSGGHILRINAPRASDAHPFVQSLKLNGDSTSSLWLPWGAVQNGATLDFTLGGKPSSWGGSPQDAPPSYPPYP